jgi:nicotinate-nucleotide adenylyltransferase
MKRYGIFGGTFNPPHTAHLIHAECVRDEMSLDKVIFIPSANPPLKTSPDVIDAAHRFNMAKLAFQHDKNFEVSDIEINSPDETSYTVSTLLKLKDFYKNDDVKLFLIIGMDNLIQLPQWKTPNKLFSMAEVLVINRPGYYIEDAPEEFVRRVVYVPVPSLEISSTLIRSRVQLGKSIKYLVPEKVINYISENKLYKNG